MPKSRNERLDALAAFARRSYLNKNRGQALVETIAKAVALASDSETPASETFEILVPVMIGRSLTERGEGQWFVGGKLGALGFQEDLRDHSDQSAHAVAGMYMGWSPLFPYGFEQIVSLLTELAPSWFRDAPPEWHDMRLYSIASSLGRRVNNSNYRELPERVRVAICDDTVKLPLLI